MNLFENFGLSYQLQIAIKKLGFTSPTQIQDMSMPHIMMGRDVIGESATGSGKTLAFGCGIIDQVKPKEGLQALVLTPTRELAEQVKDSIRQLSYKKHLKIITVYGGVSINPQIRNLSRAEVAVATPGRLLDHLRRGTIDMSKIKLLVLDEADRMLDMGFIDDVEKIIQACPNNRQTLFFSATISSRIKQLGNRYMSKPINVSATRLVDPDKLKQVYYEIPKNMKLSLLVHLLQNEKSELAMVFCNTRRTTDFVGKNLCINNINAISIHGGITQNKRTKTIKLFNDARAGVLVCTDVAARGLDIDNVSHIYNYDLPNCSIDYVHRIGRTARMGETGKVINLLCEEDFDNLYQILYDYKSFSIENIKKPYVKRIIPKKANTRGQSHRRNQFPSNNIRQSPRRRQFQPRHKWNFME